MPFKLNIIACAASLSLISSLSAVEVFTQDRSDQFKFLIDPVPASAQEGKASFKGTARPGEFYAFQIGLSSDEATAPLAVKFEWLKGASETIPADKMRCLSLGGIDFVGEPFSKEIKLAPDEVQILWCGVEIPKQAAGSFTGRVAIYAGEKVIGKVKLAIEVKGDPVENYGVDEAGNLNRLMWLDSTAGIEDSVTKPYIPVEASGNRVKVLGRELVVGENGLPAEIKSFFKPNNSEVIEQSKPVISKPFAFNITSNGKVNAIGGKLSEITHNDVEATWSSTGRTGDFSTEVTGMLDYTGSGSFTVTLTALQDTTVSDMGLETAWDQGASTYFVGLGRRGSKAIDHDWKWQKDKFQNSFWMGDLNAGMMLLFKDETFREPLVNVYYHYGPAVYSPTWANEGKGGVKLARNDAKGMDVKTYTGERSVKKGETLTFITEFYVTPFKTIDHQKHWNIRNYHLAAGGSKGHIVNNVIKPIIDKEDTANIVTIHQGKYANPYINYPYADDVIPDFKEAIELGHANDLKVRPYYTTRELSNNIPEIVALHSLNQEIIFSTGNKKAESSVAWYNENFGGHYLPAWQNALSDRPNGATLDASVLTVPDSRWDNFYMAGLDWMVDNLEIDGIYIDDSSLGNQSLQRARRIVDKRPGSIIDFHTYSFWRPNCGFGHNILIYTRIFPYIDKLWIGEEHHADREELDLFLVEMSGLPFGLTSEMLHGADGGRWKGMVFSETGRLGWAGDPRPIWEALLPLGIENTEFFPYVASNCPVKSDHSEVPASVFKGQERSFISIASWADELTDVNLDIDWEALGLDKEKVMLYAPPISNFQTEATFDHDEPITVAPGRGFVIVLEEKERERITTVADAMDSLVVSLDEGFSTPLLAERWKLVQSEKAEVTANTGRMAIKASANAHAGIETKITPKAVSLAAGVAIGTDQGMSWGPGIGLVSDKGETARFGLRSQGKSFNYQVNLNGREYQFPAMGWEKRDEAINLQISLDEKSIFFSVETPKGVQTLLKQDRSGFEGKPALARIGKMSGGAGWTDYNGPEGLGEVGESFITNVKVFTR